MSLTVLDPGLYSLLVDAGRPGSRALGVPLGGAADRAALALGNALLGNDPSAVALEVTLAGPVLTADRDTACVLFGAPFSLKIEGRDPVAAGTTFTLHAGETLRVGGTPEGVRGYLCVAGGFDSSTILGSRSALEPVKAGSVLECSESRTAGRSLGFAEAEPLTPQPPLPPRGEGGQEVPAPLSPALKGRVGEGPGVRASVLRVLPGSQRDWFPDDSFFTQSFTVTPASNRMGLRLGGAPLAKRPGEMASEPVAPGAVQVANDGLPIVLGVDGQTIGGYPKVAHVIRADLDRLAQLRPGTSVRFELVSMADAERLAKERAAWLNEWLVRLRVAGCGPVTP